MKKVIHKHKEFWSQKASFQSAFWGILFLFFSLVINYLANIYANLRASNYVSDIILDNIPVVDVGFIFFDGFILFCLLIVILLIHEPNKIPFVLKSIALFVFIRSIFIALTHIAPPPIHSYLDPGRFLLNMTSGNDMFFSSHTGLPFLMALIFWRDKITRLVFILFSAIFAVSVLLGHLHYSIDVFAAYFITYGIFHIAQRIFLDDHQLHLSEFAVNRQNLN